MRRTRGGYTIIEVLVVLAVGTIIFFAAVALFAGKQGKTQFSQAMRDVESEMQSIVNDVGVSLFPDSTGFKCQTNGSEKPKFVANGAAETGNNQDCIFLGKAVAVDNSTDANKLLIYTVIGSRLDKDGNIIGTIDKDSINVANPEPFTADGSDPDLTETYSIHAGATVVSSKTDLDTTNNSQTYLIGFYNGQQSTAQQGSLSLLTLGYTGFDKANNPAQVKSWIEGNGSKQGEPIRSWDLCFQSGTSDERAKLVVSSSAAGISTSIVYGDCS